MRRGRAGSRRFIAASVVTGCCVFALLLALEYNPRKIGVFLFNVLGLLALIDIAMSGDAAGQLFSEERRNKTLGLIFTTGISVFEVLIGKLAALFVIPLSRFLTLIPGLMIVFVLGGASRAACFAAFGMLLSLLALWLSVNLFSSLLFQEQSSGRMFAEILVLATVAILPIVSGLNSWLAGVPLPEEWLRLGPGYGAWILHRNPHAASVQDVWISVGTSLALSLAFIAGASVLADKAWKDQVFQGAQSQGAITRMLKRFNPGRRAAGALERNPYEWLVGRDFKPIILSNLFLAAIMILWLLGYAAWGAQWLSPVNLWLTCLIISGAIRWMIHYCAARQIGRDRADGGLELLLTSDLSVAEIVSGQKAEMRHYTKAMFTAVAAIFLGFFLLGLAVRPMQGQALINYFLVWIVVAALGPWMNLQDYWSSFWISLNSGRPGLALRRHFWQKGAFAWVYFQAYVNRKSLASVPTGNFEETLVLLILIAGGGLALLFYLLGWLQTGSKFEIRALEEMREVAAEPVPEASDPRLKKLDSFLEKPPEEKILV